MTATDKMCREAIRTLWIKLGFDPLDPAILHVEPTRIKVSQAKKESLIAEIYAEYPKLKYGEAHVEWLVAYIQHGPRLDSAQVDDVIVMEGGVTYGYS